MIINPWLFYLIGVAENVGAFTTFVGILLIIISIISAMIIYAENNLKNKTIKLLTKTTIMGFIFILISILTPSREISYQMLAASLATRENIEYVAETGKDLVDYICESAGIILKNEQMVKKSQHRRLNPCALFL